VITQIKQRLKADPKLDWFDPEHRQQIKDEEIPDSLANREKQIISQIDEHM